MNPALGMNFEWDLQNQGTEFPEEKVAEKFHPVIAAQRSQNFFALASSLLASVPGVRNEIESLSHRTFSSFDRFGEYVLGSATTRRQAYWALLGPIKVGA